MSTGQATLSGVGSRGAVLARRPAAGGVLVAAAMTVAAVGGTVVEIVELAAPTPPPVTAVALAVLAGLATAARRTPAAAASAMVALCLLYHLLGFPGLAPAVVLFAGLYTVTERGSGGRSVLIVAALIVGVSLVPLLPPHPVGFGWSILGPAIGLVAAAAVGEAVRARRVAVEEQLTAVRRDAEQQARQRVAEDRVEVAREVHDVLAHTITVIAVQAAAAAEALDERPEESRAALAVVRDAARDALGELRATVTLLRAAPQPAAAAPGLAHLAALRDRAAATGLDVTLDVTADQTLPGTVEHAVYRIVQEALTNTVRHAGASRAAVAVHVETDTVSVQVDDDGTGSGPGGGPRGGHGLTGMHERVRALGGTLQTGSAPGRGFTVTASLPTRPHP